MVKFLIIDNNPYKTYCEHCMSKLTFSESDTYKRHNADDYDYIKCPKCGNDVIIGNDIVVLKANR